MKSAFGSAYSLTDNSLPEFLRLKGFQICWCVLIDNEACWNACSSSLKVKLVIYVLCTNYTLPEGILYIFRVSGVDFGLSHITRCGVVAILSEISHSLRFWFTFSKISYCWTSWLFVYVTLGNMKLGYLAFVFCLLFEIRFLCVSLTVLELAL